MKMLWRWMKAVLLLPFNVLVVIPALVLYGTDYHWQGYSMYGLIFGIILFVAGLFLALWTMGLFAKIGQGTAAPWDPPQKLVVAGPYRHVRNPMISSVLMILLAESLWLQSGYILLLFLLFGIGNMIYFPFFEERDLERRFGEDYRCYKRNVPRWIPRLKAWHSDEKKIDFVCHKMPKNGTYCFESPLEEGKIVCRPNRFIMQVEKDGSVFICHCPSTGKIGNITLEGLPCLLSPSVDTTRKTTHTVEAISLDHAKSWMGINQNAANRYVEHFFRSGLLNHIAANGHKILREQKIGHSKLDFKIEDTYVEVKTPLMYMPWLPEATPLQERAASYFERFMRHLTDLSDAMKSHENAAMLTCFIYDAPIFQIPKPTEKNKIIRDAVRHAIASGVKMWQLNMSIDPRGVNLIKYFDITYLFTSSMSSW
jgi:sugar fermentation stimulation protein A